MTFDLQWLTSAIDKIGSAVDGVDAAFSGFARASYQARCAAGYCSHEGWAYIGPGWRPSVPSSAFVPGVFRTKDFVKAYKSIDGDGRTAAFFNDMTSAGGRLVTGYGCDTYPPVPNNDLVTHHAYSSVTGAGVWDTETGGASARECGRYQTIGEYVYNLLGIKYTGHANPTYEMPRDVWRRPISGGAWSLRNADLGIKRRSFASAVDDNRGIIIGGADDLRTTGGDPNYRTCHNDILVTTDGYNSLTLIGYGPFRPAYGRQAVIAWGHLILSGGAYGDGPLASQVQFLNECWAVPLSTDLSPGNWVQIAPMPEALNHHMFLSLPINGVETIAVIGGYNNLTYSGGGPIGKIWTLNSLSGSWQARTDSDFWV